MRLFELIAELTDVGVELTFERDFGGNTLTVLVKYPEPIFRFGNEYVSTTHFHSGYPDCKASEGSTSLIQNLERVQHEVGEYRSSGLRQGEEA